MREDIGWAVREAKGGGNVRRKSWPPGVFVYFVREATTEITRRHALWAHYPEGSPVKYRAHLALVTPSTGIAPYFAGPDDLLGRDWEHY